MNKQYMPQSKIAARFFKSGARQTIALETLESRQLLSAAPMPGFQPAPDIHAPTFESGHVPNEFATEVSLVDPARLIDLQFSGRDGMTIPISIVKVPPAREAVDILIPDWLVISDGVYTDGKDPSNLPPSDWHAGNDFQLPEYEFPSPYDPEPRFPGTELNEPYIEVDGGFTPNLPPSSLEDPGVDLGSYNSGPDVIVADREAEEVLGMLASLQYVPGDKRGAGEVRTHSIPTNATTLAEEAGPAANDNLEQSTPIDGGMVKLPPTSLVRTNEVTHGGPTIDFEQLLTLPPQMDPSRGNYQAFEVFSDETEPVQLESVLDASFVPSHLGPQPLNELSNETGRDVTVSDSEPSSVQMTDFTDAPMAPIDTSTGSAGVRTLNTAGAIAIVVLASRTARVRDEEDALGRLSHTNGRVAARDK